jgi:L-seryl-tRNA(Ser) seleniumtransferase
MTDIIQSPPQHYRDIPGVDALLQSSPESLQRWGHAQLTEALRDELSCMRSALKSGKTVELDSHAIVARVEETLTRDNRASLKPVINLTGTVLHTNLGRASLPEIAIEAVAAAARQPTNLEFDLRTGKRGDRESHIESLICELTGAEAATAVNNNAAAVLLLLNTLAMGKQVPVSRGELVEIGGSFRIPEVMLRSGCQLVEVGATNRTHLKDFADAITDNTALLMKVHASNYAIQGFTAAVSETDLAELAHAHDLPLVIDLGSGNLLDYAALGLPPEPTVSDAIAAGADLVTFSGDKLLGGPQAGIIAGRRDLIAQIKQNPLKRALRLDKMTLAALEEVLRLYRRPEELSKSLPTVRHLTRPLADIEALAEYLCPILQAQLAAQYAVSVATGFSQIGSGAMPVETLPTAVIHIRPLDDDDAKLRQLVERFRSLPVPVIGRVNNGVVIFDLRCLDDKQLFVEQLSELGAVSA